MLNGKIKMNNLNRKMWKNLKECNTSLTIKDTKIFNNSRSINQLFKNILNCITLN